MTSDPLKPGGRPQGGVTGALFLVIGASGVGKDALIDGARAALGASRSFRFPRRIITRDPDPDGEDHLAVSQAEFERLRRDGAFLRDWRAHDLRYGVPRDVCDDLASGVNVVLNVSRRETAALRAAVAPAPVIVIEITAPPATVAARLRARGRETEAEIARRLARIVERPPGCDGALELCNDGSIEDGVAALVDMIAGTCALTLEARLFPAAFGSKALCLLHRDNPVAGRLLRGAERVALGHGGAALIAELGWTGESALVGVDQCALSGAAIEALGAEPGATVAIDRSPPPASRATLRKKIRGEALTEGEMRGFVDDLVTGRYSAAEVAGFLVSASTALSLDEIVSLTKARAEHAHRQRWRADIVVDKHSMGGIPGNRITPIIIPIVAAFGLTIPKTSSRAITSAAGTADVMEVLARVDLTPQEMRAVVDATGACIAWNGRLTHSPVDDVMNAINRPLGLASTLLDVSSIMSKKLAAGSTHVLVDLPVGPQAKTRTPEEALALKAVFETVGGAVGLETRVHLADGAAPVGCGVGPVLEALDVLRVLEGDPAAPADLRDKALLYAGMILEWCGGVEAGAGRATALDLLRSGAALRKLRAIMRAQSAGARSDGARPPCEQPPAPGRFTWTLEAAAAGRIEAFDLKALASLARTAGAPLDKAAGVAVLAQAGAALDAHQPILRIHASSRSGLDAAREAAATLSPVLRWGA